MTPFPGMSGIIQYCFQVPDIDVAIENWITTTGAGPFFLRRNIALDVIYRGEKSHLNLDIALGQMGSAHIELIQQNSDGPSVYTDVYPDLTGGFHHIAMLAKDFDGTVAHYTAAGHPLGMSGTFGSFRLAYFDLTATLGYFVELLEDVDDVRNLYRMVSDAAIDWTGESPLRTF